MEDLPTQAGGRVKPLYVLADETIKFITGKSQIQNLSAVEAFCLLSVQSMGLKNDLDIPIRIDHSKVKEILNISQEESSLPAQKLMEQKDLLRSEYMQQKQNDAYKKELNKVLTRLSYYEQTLNGSLWSSPSINQNEVHWLSLPEFLTQDKVQSTALQGKEAFLQVFKTAKKNYIELKGDSYLLELTYSKLKLFSWAMISVLLALIFLTLKKSSTVGLFFTASTLTIELIAMVMRIFISGRAPITNMYETVMFSGFGALSLAIIIYSYKKDKVFLFGGLSYNLLCLLMMKFANNMLDPSIQNLVPVLRDNFWLSTHVTTIILSYAALALSWMLANIVLIKSLRKKLEAKDRRYYTSLIYSCLKYGVALLSAGIILGGVWADYSWGRFWGWDPKETWSLIVLLFYMAILHGKYSKWVTDRNFIPLVAAAFLSVMMAWFGVNYILATGLHSYGFSEGGAIFLASFFTIQISVLLLYYAREKIKADHNS